MNDDPGLSISLPWWIIFERLFVAGKPGTHPASTLISSRICLLVMKGAFG